MKIQKQIFYFVLISFSILLANYIWPLIKLSNNNEIAGANLQNDYHSFSDAIRYISYILIPVTSPPQNQKFLETTPSFFSFRHQRLNANLSRQQLVH